MNERKTTAASSAALLLAFALISCSGQQTQQHSQQQRQAEEKPPQTEATKQAWQLFASKAEFPPCTVDTRDQLFYDVGAQQLYVCEFGKEGYSFQEAVFDELKGNKGPKGDKGAQGNKGPNGPAGPEGD